MARDPGATFNRVFARSVAGGAGDIDDGGAPPSVHELFSMVMRDQLSVPDFGAALHKLHGIPLTPAALRLLNSVDGGSGRLSFAQFQRALSEGAGDHYVGAGKPNIFRDQAAAIISDNCGEAVPATPGSAAKVSTDISADPFVRAEAQLAHGQTRGPFNANPVVRTNKASAGNPLAVRVGAPASATADAGAPREMANTATRMYMSGELARGEYEEFLGQYGVSLGGESELHKLILEHEQSGTGSYAQLSRALQREIARPDMPAASPGG